MRSFFSAKSSTKRQQEHAEYDEDSQYDSSDDSTTPHHIANSGSKSKFSSRNPYRQESQKPTSAAMSIDTQQSLEQAAAERKSYGNVEERIPAQVTRFPTAHALKQPDPKWAMKEPAQRHHNSDAASPISENLRTSSPESAASHNRNRLPVTTNLPIRGSKPGKKHSIARKPMNKPAKRVLIAVFGMTGTGKTTFIKTLSGEAADKLRTGHDLESCTQEIETVDFRLDDCNITLVDTPGFVDSKRSDTEILKLIADWLGRSYKDETLLSGIIYLHRISDVRMSGSSIKNLSMFRKLCGGDNMSKVCLVTTMWDKVTDEEGSTRERHLQRSETFWRTMIASGSSIRRHDRGIQSAQEVIRSMLVNKPTTIKLQDEIVSGKTLVETDAGASINEEILKMKKKHEEDLDVLKDEMALAMAQDNKKLQAKLQADHARIVSKLEQQSEQRFQLAQTRINNLERRYKDAANKRERDKQELRASAAKEHELRIAAERRQEQSEQAFAARERERLEQASKAREHELRMTAARERERFEQASLPRERGRFEETPRRRDADAPRPDHNRPNI
ncbi:hypothetical protein LARI1_G005745, partial [Lachnellula arida]